MKLSRNQKRCAYILGACAVALLVDRVFLAPGEADAGEPDAQTPIAVFPTVTPSNRAPVEPIPHKPLAGRFAKLAEDRGLDPATISDAFEVPWVIIEDIIVESDDFHPELKAFRSAHRLNAVMELGDVKHAIVDGRRMGLGQVIEGFELLEIRERSVVFESPRFLKVEIKLLDAGGQGGTPE